MDYSVLNFKVNLWCESLSGTVLSKFLEYTFSNHTFTRLITTLTLRKIKNFQTSHLSRTVKESFLYKQIWKSPII